MILPPYTVVDQSHVRSTSVNIAINYVNNKISSTVFFQEVLANLNPAWGTVSFQTSKEAQATS